jgi:hypothetical protein
VERGVDGGEYLHGLHLPESQHGSLSSPTRQVTIFDPVIGPAADLLFLAISQHVHRCAVRAQAVDSDRRHAPVPFWGLLGRPRARASSPQPPRLVGAFALTVPEGAVSLMVTCLRWTHKPQSGLELIP